VLTPADILKISQGNAVVVRRGPPGPFCALGRGVISCFVAGSGVAPFA
jgi:hypothetical protein